MGGCCYIPRPREILWWYWLALLGIFGVPLLLTGLAYRKMKTSLGKKNALFFAALVFFATLAIITVVVLFFLIEHHWTMNLPYVYMVVSFVWLTAFLYKSVDQELGVKILHFIGGYLIFAAPLLLIGILTNVIHIFSPNFNLGESLISMGTIMLGLLIPYLPLSILSWLYIRFDSKPSRASAVVFLLSLLLILLIFSKLHVSLLFQSL
jgi:hypothetical protein